MRVRSLFILLCIVAQGPAFAAAPTMAEVIAHTTDADWRPLDIENTLYMQLAGGRVIIELAPAFAPKHVANIEALVREGYFDGLAVIRSQDGYVTQWGDPEETGPRVKPIRTAQKTLAAEFTVAATPVLPFTRLPDADGYAPEVGFSAGFPAGRDPRTRRAWLCHCYGMVGVARDEGADTGGGSSLYAVIGHAPRHLDRNITVVGRVVQGMELLSSVPRGTAPLGFYAPAQRIAIASVHIAADLPPAQRTPLQVMKTESRAFLDVIEARRNRREPWFKTPAGYVELCNVPIPVR